MEPADVSPLLEPLIATWENEVVEFKQAADGFSTDDIGENFSALPGNLRRAGMILNTGSRARPVWKLAERMRKGSSPK